ncbi:MAG: L,D-transpeptidase [Luteolibacter sp.]|uniref:L,D-transpeptidase n=1 Tax=Luteolibacter sp. TaxID=1962973 RepID=UPI003266A7A3
MTGFSKPSLFLISFFSLLVAAGLTSCGSNSFSFGGDTHNKMIVSVQDQKMLLVRDGTPVKSYKISTSKFGVGDGPGSNRTPLGRLQVAKKIGDNAPIGCVFKARRPTGEVIVPNAPGRDPVVTRIMWLSGTESRNQNAFRRTIYIHGTPEERRLGTPASYGCIRMGSKDVADLYNRIGTGADVFIIRGSIQTKKEEESTASTGKSNIRSRG